MMNYQHIAVIALLMTTLQATAADIAREIHSPSGGSSAFAELGIVLGAERMPLIGFNDQELEFSDSTVSTLGIGVIGRLEYERFFAEFIENSFSNATIGAIAWSGENSEIEVVFSSYFGRTSRKRHTGLETITDRKGDFNAGLRGSYYFGNGMAQFELVHDIIDSHNGVSASLQFGQQTQVRNWNLHALFGVRYFSADVIDHLFGVSEAESTPDFPTYVADHGFMPTIQIGAALPLSERWVFRALGEYSRLPNSVTSSPLAQGDIMYSVQGGVYYVFGGR